MAAHGGDRRADDSRPGSVLRDGGWSVGVVLRRMQARAADESGVAVFLTLLFMAFLFVIGLIAVNAAVMFGARVSTQRAADAATLAGCFDLPNATKASSSAVRFGSSGGGLNATTADNLESGRGNQAASPAITSSGAFSARTGEILENDRIRVDIGRTQGLIGAPSSGFVDQSIGAYAICTREEGPIAVLTALNGGGSATLNITGSTLDVGENGIIACSSSGSGLVITGSTVSADYIDTRSGTGQSVGSSVDPWPPTQRDDCPNQFESAPDLAPTGPQETHNECLYIPPFLPPRPGEPRTCLLPFGGTLNSGVHYGGVQLGSVFCFFTGCNVELRCVTDPCVFHMVGGGFTVSTNTTVTGSGAVIFNGPGDVEDCAPIAIGASSRFEVTPPSGGAFDGVLFRQSAACALPMSVQGDVILGVASSNPGGIYLPAATLNVDSTAGFGPAGSTLNSIVTANRIQIVGPLSWGVPFIPSGTVHHGDYNLTE